MHQSWVRAETQRSELRTMKNYSRHPEHAACFSPTWGLHQQGFCKSILQHIPSQKWDQQESSGQTVYTVTFYTDCLWCASNKHPFLLRHRTKPFLQRYRQQQIWLSFLYKPTYQRGPLWLSFCFWVTCTEIKISFAQHQALEQAGQVSSDRELGARWGCWQAVLRPTHILYICPEGVHVTVLDSFKCCFWHRFTCLNWSEYFDGKN